MDIIKIKNCCNVFHPINGRPIMLGYQIQPEMVVAVWDESQPTCPTINHNMVTAWWEETKPKVQAIEHLNGKDHAWEYLESIIEQFDTPKSNVVLDRLDKLIQLLIAEKELPKFNKQTKEELKELTTSKFPLGIKSLDTFVIILGKPTEEKMLMIMW